MRQAERSRLPRVWVDFNTIMRHPDGWVFLPQHPDANPRFKPEAGMQVLLEENTSVEVDGVRLFVDDVPTDYESIEVEAVLHLDDRYREWVAEP